MTVPRESLIVQVVTRLMVPMIQIFAFYVIFHGHYSPGGGFQGGALLAGSVLVQRVVFGLQRSEAAFAYRLGVPFGVLGALIYFLIGIVPQLSGANFLDYDELPIPGLGAVMLRNTGILLIEIGVAFAVMGVLISIFDQLAGADEGDDSTSENGRWT